MYKQQQIINRNEYLIELQQFVSSSKISLKETLQKLNWTEETTIFKENEKLLYCCPLDPVHRVSKGHFDQHFKRCQWHMQGYMDNCVPLPSHAGNPKATVIIDKKLQEEIILKAAIKDPMFKIGSKVRNRDVPQTSDSVSSDFTSDERRVLYDYVVSRTKGVMPQLKEFSLPSEVEQVNSEQGNMTQQQLLKAAERDAKRRRVRYRTAKVHTKSKNYSEVLREMINNQMSAYEYWLRDNYGEESKSSLVQTEKKESDGAVVEEQEKIWLNWDYRSNPHIWWKYVLRKEKERAEKKDDVKETDHQDKEKDVEVTNSRKNCEKNQSRKDKYYDHSKGRHESHPRKKFDESKITDFDRSDRRKEYSYSKERVRSRLSISSNCENKYRRDNDEYRHSSRYERNYCRKSEHHSREMDLRSCKDSNKSHKYTEMENRHITSKKEYDRDYSSDSDHVYKITEKEKLYKRAKPTQEENEGSDSSGLSISKKMKREKSKIKHNPKMHYHGINIKREFNDDSSNSGDHYQIRKKQKLYERVRCKQEEGERSDSSRSSSYSHTNQSRKRKKSKKKHKHKHRVENRQRHKRSSQYYSSAESTDY